MGGHREKEKTRQLARPVGGRGLGGNGVFHEKSRVSQSTFERRILASTKEYYPALDGLVGPVQENSVPNKRFPLTQVPWWVSTPVS